VRWCELNLSASGYEQAVGHCEHGNENVGSIKCEKLFD